MKDTNSVANLALYMSKQKSFTSAVFIWLFLGLLFIHRVYLGKKFIPFIIFSIFSFSSLMFAFLDSSVSESGDFILSDLAKSAFTVGIVGAMILAIVDVIDLFSLRRWVDQCNREVHEEIFNPSAVSRNSSSLELDASRELKSYDSEELPLAASSFLLLVFGGGSLALLFIAISYAR